MRLSNILLALLVVAVWGINFVAIKVALVVLPPLMLCALRFFLVSFPAILFIKPPASPWWAVALFGLIMFALQLGLAFCGMYAGTSAGLASLIMQTHVFFTVLLAVLLLGERPTVWQLAGAMVAFVGIGLVGMNLGGEVSLPGLLLIVGSAAAWALGNLISKKLGKIDMLALVVWGGLAAWPPLLGVSFWLEQAHWQWRLLEDLSLAVGLSVVYTTYPNTLFGFAAWSWLLSRYPAATVAPFTLLVPVFGFGSSMLYLGEPLQIWKLQAGALVITGLAINLFGRRIYQRIRLVF